MLCSVQSAIELKLPNKYFMAGHAWKGETFLLLHEHRRPEQSIPPTPLQAGANTSWVPRGSTQLHARENQTQDVCAQLPGADRMDPDRKRTACQGKVPSPTPLQK